MLCFSDPTLLPEVYHRHSEKTSFYNPGVAGEKPALLQIQDDHEHAVNIKVVGPTVSLTLPQWGQCKLTAVKVLDGTCPTAGTDFGRAYYGD